MCRIFLEKLLKNLLFSVRFGKITGMKEVKDCLAENLTRLRQASGITQSELAKTLNYTDKSVSKWEHGDAVPPIDVLKKLADIYDVTLDFLTEEHSDSEYDRKYNVKGNRPNKIIITLLAVSLVWIIATLLFIYGLTLAQGNYWQVFVFSVPVSIIVLIVFNGIWGRRRYTFVLISLLVWSGLASIYILFLENNPWAIFIIGLPVQVAIILWSQLKRS